MIARLRRRFILIATASAALVVVLLSVIVNLANLISTDAGLTNLLEIICDNAGSIPAPRRDNGPGGRRGGPLTQETPYSTRYFLIRYTEDGTLTHVDLKHIAAVTEEDVEPYAALAFRHGPGYGYTQNYKYHVVYHGNGKYMAVFLDCYQEMRSVKLLALLSLLADLICVGVVYLLVVVLSRRAIDPLVRSAQRQKQFITDASHELKTPLTVITTSLKVLEMEVGAQKWIDKAQRQAEKMTGLVQSLVTLSRMDEDEPPLTFTDFDISAAVEETAETFRETISERGFSLELDLAPGIFYHGDETAVRQMIAVLMDNAAKYASGSGPVTLSLRKEHRAVVIHTGNPCEAIEDSELKKLFDRFYRADASRSSAVGGFGVGLSIARSIAEAHRGSLSAQCPVLGTIDFTAVLK